MLQSVARLVRNVHRKSMKIMKIIETSMDLGDHSSAIVTYLDFSSLPKLPNSRKSSSTWKHWKLRGMREQLRSLKLRFQECQSCQPTRHLPIWSCGHSHNAIFNEAGMPGIGWAWWKSRQGRASQSQTA